MLDASQGQRTVHYYPLSPAQMQWRHRQGRSNTTCWLNEWTGGCRESRRVGRLEMCLLNSGFWEESGACGSSAGKVANGSLTSWPPGPSCQAPGHLRPGWLPPSRWAKNVCHHRPVGGSSGMPSLSCLLVEPKSLVTANRAPVDLTWNSPGSWQGRAEGPVSQH